MKEKNKILLLLALAGMLTGAAVVLSEYVGVFRWITLIPLFFALRMQREKERLTKRRAYVYGLFYFECYYVVCFHWFLYLYPLDFTGLDKFTSILVVLIAWFGLSFLQALFGGLCFSLYIGLSRSSLVKKYPIADILLFPLIYTFYEYTQTLGWWGVPWGRLPIAAVDSLIPAQTAALFGSYFVTFVILLVNSAIAYALMCPELRRRRFAVAVALATYLANMLAGGVIFIAGEAKAASSQTVRVGIVQPNFDSTEKWSSTPYDILQRHLDYTVLAAEDGAEVVIWPETALPFEIYEFGSYANSIAEVAKKYGITILVGTLEYDGENEYNSIFCFDTDGSLCETVYRKRHLVPFGEYVPMRSFIEAVVPFMSEISMLDSDMTAGEDTAIFDTEHVRIGSLICFDSIYEELTYASVRDGAELLAISTNDSWFRDSRGIYMHNNQARLRSIEVGRATVRSANTGISSVITNTGKVINTIPPLEEGYITEEIALTSGRTLCSYIGNTFVYLCGASIGALAIYEIIVFIKNRRSGKDPDRSAVIADEQQ